MQLSINKLITKLQKKIAHQDFSKALYLIQSFVEQIVYLPQSAGNVISSSILDEQCQIIGAKILANNSVKKKSKINTNLIVYTVTQLYTAGGHTAVLEDLIKYQPDKQHLILITDIFHADNQQAIEKRFAQFPVQFIWCPNIPLAERVNWLQQHLANLQPQKTFLFNHHQDAVAIAAVQPNLIPELYFFHHADHHLCLGVHLVFAIHIDAQSLGFNQCRHMHGVKNNIYWPLVVPDKGARSATQSFMSEGRLTTACSGSPGKFETPYLYSYAELLPSIMKVTQGKHIHIGKLSATTLQTIRLGLQKNNIDPQKFIYISWVPSVWQAIQEHKVDLYLNSFPISGGRATIEILGSGTPIVMHENYRSEYLGQVYMAYPQAFFWRKPQELLDYLTTLSPNLLQQHSHYARSHYERYHAPEILQQELVKSISEQQGIIPPTLPQYRKDNLLVFLEDYQALNLLNFGKKYLLQMIFSHPWITKKVRKMRKYLKNNFI